MKTIDLNCDLGESFGAYKIGLDEQVLPYITSANIACGFHAGDAHVMQRTVRLAKQEGVAIGAHPGFQDLAGFGRRNMAVSATDVHDIVLYQLGALTAFCKANNALMTHVKPHGAMYNMAAIDEGIADAIVSAVFAFDHSLFLYGLAGSHLLAAGERFGLRTVSEVFADRTYQHDGTLTPRTEPNAVITDVDQAIQQVLQIIHTGTIQTITGETIAIQADSICVHGDNEHAVSFVKKLRTTLEGEGIMTKAIRG